MSSKKFSSRNTRNVCILAHVDHGKSSYADSLLAYNNIISSRLAGKIRYLDSREDEQERGITMESSAVSLSYKVARKSDAGVNMEDYMINLIDTPGHVDFSSEVSTASRLCDGALILVDAVEGTITVLRQAWAERLRPILVINKIDRLITELELSPIEAYHHLSQLIEQVNAVVGGFHASERMEDDARWREDRDRRMKKKAEERGESAAELANENKTEGGDASGSAAEDEEEQAFEERSDEDIYFEPETGNVIFASAIDGWAFRVSRFAQIWATKLGIKEGNLRKVLWGDFYLDPKTKRVLARKHLGKRNLKPMFVQFVLENLWAVYDAVAIHHNMEKITKIVSALGIKVRPQELKSKETRTLLQAIFSQWLPLAPATFRAIIEIVPSPSAAQSIRLPKMLHPDIPYHQTSLPPTNKLEKDLYEGNDVDGSMVVCYVSKMFAVPTSELPQNQRRQLTADEMRERGRAGREKLIGEATGAVPISAEEASPQPSAEEAEAKKKAEEEKEDAKLAAEEEALSAESIIGFSRLYSGTMRVGQTLHCVLPKYNTSLPPSHPSNARHLTRVTITHLYMIMGRELVLVESVPAGNVFGIGGLEGTVLRNATLCAMNEKGIQVREGYVDQERDCLVNLVGVHLLSAPIVRVALEPRDPSKMPKLVEGLRLLNQADPAVETLVQETGEHVILTAGELHLERCLRDLRERFAKIAIQASPPIVPFRETAVAGVEMAAIKTPGAPRGTIQSVIQNGLLSFETRARPLPQPVHEFLLSHTKSIKRLQRDKRTLASSVEEDAAEEHVSEAGGATEEILNPEQFWSKLDKLFSEAGREWAGVSDRIWAFGPRRTGANLLLDDLPGSHRALKRRARETQKPGANGISTDGPAAPESAEVDAQSENKPVQNGSSYQLDLRDFDEAFDTAFQLATLRGPLCAEPVTGMAYSVQKFDADATLEQESTRWHTLNGALISTVQEALRNGLLDWSPRLLLAMYSCDIQATTEVLGKVYGVVARRRGRIVSEEIREGTTFFTISAMLPVVESFGFADEIRKRTSGAASPQLVFHGFDMLDQDPFWVPTTEEELEDLGEKADKENVARKYMDGVRKRKGMFVERKIVEHAEKQRTMKK